MHQAAAKLQQQLDCQRADEMTATAETNLLLQELRDENLQLKKTVAAAEKKVLRAAGLQAEVDKLKASLREAASELEDAAAQVAESDRLEMQVKSLQEQIEELTSVAPHKEGGVKLGMPWMVPLEAESGARGVEWQLECKVLTRQLDQMRARCRQTELSKAAAVDDLQDQIRHMHPEMRDLRKAGALHQAANVQLGGALEQSDNERAQLQVALQQAENAGLELQGKLQACVLQLQSIRFEDQQGLKQSLGSKLQMLEDRLQLSCDAITFQAAEERLIWTNEKCKLEAELVDLKQQVAAAGEEVVEEQKKWDGERDILLSQVLQLEDKLSAVSGEQQPELEVHQDLQCRLDTALEQLQIKSQQFQDAERKMAELSKSSATAIELLANEQEGRATDKRGVEARLQDIAKANGELQAKLDAATDELRDKTRLCEELQRKVSGLERAANEAAKCWDNSAHEIQNSANEKEKNWFSQVARHLFGVFEKRWLVFCVCPVCLWLWYSSS